MSEEQKEEQKEVYELVEVPLEMGIVVRKGKEDINQLQLLVNMANTLDELKKNLIG